MKSKDVAAKRRLRIPKTSIHMTVAVSQRVEIMLHICIENRRSRTQGQRKLLLRRAYVTTVTVCHTSSL